MDRKQESRRELIGSRTAEVQLRGTLLCGFLYRNLPKVPPAPHSFQTPKFPVFFLRKWQSKRVVYKVLAMIKNRKKNQAAVITIICRLMTSRHL